LASSFGKTCNPNSVEVVALSSTADEWEVVSLPVRHCEMARIRLSEDDGELQPIDRVKLDLPPR
jgi:hypothetical protein